MMTKETRRPPERVNNNKYASASTFAVSETDRNLENTYSFNLLSSSNLSHTTYYIWILTGHPDIMEVQMDIPKSEASRAEVCLKPTSCLLLLKTYAGCSTTKFVS